MLTYVRFRTGLYQVMQVTGESTGLWALKDPPTDAAKRTVTHSSYSWSIKMLSETADRMTLLRLDGIDRGILASTAIMVQSWIHSNFSTPLFCLLILYFFFFSFWAPLFHLFS